MPTQPTSERARSILILASSPEDDRALRAALNPAGPVHVVHTCEEALAALGSQRYDAVAAPVDDLLTLAHEAGRSRSETILERISEGVCLVARDGRMTWANRKLRSYPPEVVEAIRTECAELCAELADQPPAEGVDQTRRSALNVGRDYYFDLTASALPGEPSAAGSAEAEHAGPVQQVVVLVSDVTATRGLQKKLDAINAAGRDLVRLDAEAFAEMDVGERLQLLEEKIVRYGRELLHFDHFVVRVRDKQSNRLDTVLATGLSEEAKSLEISATIEGGGISGYVAATGRSYLCPDVSTDPRYLPGLESARSSLTVPLWLHDQVVGILNVESEREAAFSEDDRQVAEIFCRQIAVALHILKLLAVERRATTGQIASDVTADLAAPLNDIVTDATNAIEQHVNDDRLRDRLHAIIDNVDRVKRTIHAVSEVRGISGLVPQVTTTDPVLDGKRVLVADDEEIIRETIADVLAKGGALTVMARDGAEAVAMIHAQHFDLVLSDIKMPHKNGYEVFAAAKETNAQCPVILITGFGYDPNHSIVRASTAGLAAVLFKPFKVDKLLDDVRRALTSPPG